MQSHESGLSAEEARRRLVGIGPNLLPSRKSSGAVTRWLACFSEALTCVLLVAAIFTGIAGRWLDTGAILAVVALNGLIGWLQRRREAHSPDAPALLPRQALVRRDGEAYLVDVCELVPGDIVMLRAGDKVPADLRLIEAQNLLADETILNGLAAPVAKQAEAIDSEQPSVSDNMLLCGTAVASGSATGIVVATGKDTALGKTERLLAAIPSRRTPLLRQLDPFGNGFFLLVILLIVSLFGFALLWHRLPINGLIQTLAGLAVAAAPAALPMVVVLTLTLSARRMAKKKVSVHSLSTMETLGAASVIFCDKTDMLTLNEIMDPPCPEAVKAIADCHRAGIKVKIIADDRPETAQAIGRLSGVGNSHNVLTGSQLQSMSDAELALAASRCDIFTLIDSPQKLRLVTALQSQGEVVAITGSGIKDAPALKQADIGIATGAATGNLTLANNSLATLVEAIGEGRRVRQNLEKAVQFALPVCLAQAMLFIVAMLTGKITPLMPLQALWLNMVTAAVLALSLAFEKADPQLARHKAGYSLKANWLFWRTCFAGMLIALSIFIVEDWLQACGYASAFIHTVLLQTLVVAQWVYLLFCREPGRFSLNAGLLKSGSFWLATIILALLQLAIVTLPGMQKLFGTTSLPPESWLITLAVGALLFLLFELEKGLTHRLRQMPAETGQAAE